MGAISRHITRSYLRKKAPEHLARYPQLACFSFDLITDYIHLDGRYEFEELEFLANSVFPKLKGKQTCLDIGGNIGNHALFFAEHFENVITFEPNPRTFKLLDANADLADNVTAMNIGLSDNDVVQTAYFNPRNIAAASVEETHFSEGRSGLKTAEFKLKRLDGLTELQDVETIDFIKVDVEGHEEACFRGAKETLRKHQPVIGLEILGAQVRDGKTPSLGILESYGYTHFYNLRSNRPLSWAPKPLGKLSTIFLGLFFNHRPAKSFTLEPLELTSDRNFPMVLCSTFPLQ